MKTHIEAAYTMRNEGAEFFVSEDCCQNFSLLRKADLTEWKDLGISNWMMVSEML